jgi:hypothetical protein
MRTALAILALVLLPVAVFAQEASITGTISDQTGGVLPGVTITATHVETGNTFVGVTDERGTFRLPLRVGDFRIAVELSGFTTVNRTINLLLGQTAVVNLTMSPSTIQESVTVTGEAPLIDTTNSSPGRTSTRGCSTRATRSSARRSRTRTSPTRLECCNLASTRPSSRPL